jgi:putative tryptophan/tyrosine transport system substrate-binding protein
MSILVPGTALISRRPVMLASVIAVFSGAVWAQEAKRVYRLGFVVQPPKSNFGAMFDELRKRGFIEGQNLSVDPRGFSLPADRLDDAAVEVAKAGPDVIYAGGTAAGRAVQRATRTIPIVVTGNDMVRAHLVSSLAHPGGNVTGVSILSSELDSKRLELLTESVPGVSRIAALVDPETTPPDQIEALSSMARALGVTLSIHRAVVAEDVASAIEAARSAGAQAIDVPASALFHTNRAMIIARMAEAKLPAVYQWPEYGQEGALICYGPPINAFYRQAARLIAEIFRGRKPADLPVEQPTHIKLVVNLKTAKELGLNIPPMILARADEIIE